MKHKNLWIYLGIYAIIVLSANAFIDFNISNGYARSVSAAYIADSIKQSDLSYQNFVEGEEHYKIFSGIADWEPLQLILLSGSFLIIGTSKWAYIIPSLIITLSALAYIYFLVLLAYPKKRSNALACVIVVSLSVLFFFGAATPTLENGLVLFTIASMYHFIKWMSDTEKNTKHFYMMCLMLGLGVLWKSIVLLVLIPIGYIFLTKLNRITREYLPSRSTVGKGILIFIIIVSPLVAREVILSKYDVDQGAERTVGKLHYLLPQEANLPGHITWFNMEFQQGLSEEKNLLIQHRYELSYWQKLIIVLTSLLSIVWLLPALLVAYERTEVETMLLLFAVVNIVFFTMFGLIPRYMVPATVAIIIAAIMTVDIDKRIMAAMVVMCLLFTVPYVTLVANDYHVQAKQYDYEGTVKEILANTQGEFTIETFRPYPMAFYLFKHDKERRGSIDYIEGNKAWNESFVWRIKQ